MLFSEAVEVTAIADANNKNTNNEETDDNDNNKKFSDTLSSLCKPSTKRKKVVPTLSKPVKKAAKVKPRQAKLTISRSKHKSPAPTLFAKEQRKSVSISVPASPVSVSLILGSLTSRAKLLDSAEPASIPACMLKSRGLNKFIKRFSKLVI